MVGMDVIQKFFIDYPFAVYACFGLAASVYLYILMDEKRWQNLEIFLGISNVMSLPFVGSILSAWLDGNQGDNTSKILFVLILLGMVCQAHHIYCTKNASDPVVATSLTIASIVARVGLLTAAVGAMYVDGFSKAALQFDCVYLLLLIIGNFAHLKKVSTNDGEMHIDSSIRKCAIVDGIFWFVTGLLLIGFPEMMTAFYNEGSHTTPVHIMLMKSFGFQVIASSLLSFASICYKLDQDVRSIFLPKLWFVIPVIAWLTWIIGGTDAGVANWFMLAPLVVLLSVYLRIVQFIHFIPPKKTD